jgi:bifunctional UDP-N-acetylglucosamine pyrophosphorylase/glucosamine-1-phosphate N-acetyltransferase
MLSAMTAEVATPGDLGRVMRYPDGRIEIVEKEYLTEEQRALNEVNTNTFCIDRTWFEAAFVNLPLMATLGEYGLPSVLSMAQESGLPVRIVKLGCNEWYGVNSKEDLLVADRRMRQKRSEDSPRTPT